MWDGVASIFCAGAPMSVKNPHNFFTDNSKNPFFQLKSHPGGTFYVPSFQPHPALNSPIRPQYFQDFPKNPFHNKSPSSYPFHHVLSKGPMNRSRGGPLLPTTGIRGVRKVMLTSRKRREAEPTFDPDFSKKTMERSGGSLHQKTTDTKQGGTKTWQISSRKQP